MPLGNPIRKQNESRIISVLATEGQSVFTVEGGYIINQISVFRNGVRLSNSEDFTAGDGSTVTLNNEANVDDRIEFHIFDRFTVQNAIVGAASTQTINGDLVLNGKLFGQLDVPSINLTGIITATELDLNGKGDISSDLTIARHLNVAGVSTFTGLVSIASSIVHTGDTNTSIGFSAADVIDLRTGGIERLRIQSDKVQFSAHAKVDNHNVRDLGTSENRWRSLYLGTDLNVAGVSTFANTVISGVTTHNADVVFAGDNYNVSWDKSNNYLQWADNAKAVFGDSADLEIYHDGNHNYIRSNNGDLVLRDDAIDLKAYSTTDTYISCVNGGAVSLRYDNTVRAATTPSGVDVSGGINATGIVTATNFTSSGTVLIDTTSYSDASADGDDLIIGSTSDTQKGISIVGSTSGGIGNIFFTDGASYKNQGLISYRHADDSMRFHTNQSERLRIKSDGTITINSTGTQPSATVSGYQFDGTAATVRLGSGAGASGTTSASLSLMGSNHNANIENGANSGAQLNLYNYNTNDGNSSALSFLNSNGLSVARVLGLNVSHSSRTGALVFMISNGSHPTEKLRIKSDGQINITSTESLKLPVGTTAQRPSGVDGMIRFNSTLSQTEEYRDSGWFSVSNKSVVTGGTITTSGSYTIHTFTSSGTLTVSGATKSGVDYIVVAGGGGGGGTRAGGGGAGGVVVSTNQDLPAGDYTVTIGGGGGAGSGVDSAAAGGNTSLGSLQTCSGGGYGGGQGNPGGDGGSGGGGSDGASGGSGTSGQGNSGGNSTGSTGGGGGGGKGSSGTTPGNYSGGNGGTSLSNSYSGSSVEYGGGGGGGSRDNAARGTGSGGAGSGGKTTGTNATAGAANQGGGGGGGGRHSSGDSAHKNGAAGGSGIVIVRYLT